MILYEKQAHSSLQWKAEKQGLERSGGTLSPSFGTGPSAELVHAAEGEHGQQLRSHCGFPALEPHFSKDWREGRDGGEGEEGV